MAGKLLITKIKAHWVLLVILVIGAYLRWFNLSQSMSFFYDQARDALVTTGILHGDFVLVGPSADTSGLFMGPLWYYLLAPLYWLTGGNPAYVLWLTSFFDIFTIILLYLIGKTLFDRKTAIVAASLWSLGAGSIAYARTLSNPASSALWSLVIFLGLIQIQKRPRIGLLIATMGLVVILQLNLATAYLLTFWVALSLLVLRKFLPSKSTLALCLAIFLISLSPQILFEIRNQFPSWQHLTKLFFAATPGGGFIQALISRWQVFLDELAIYLFFGQRTWSLLALLLSVLIFLRSHPVRHKLLLVFWLLGPIISYFFFYLRGESHPHYLLGWIPAAVLIFGHLLSKIYQRYPVVAIGLFGLFIFQASLGWNQTILQKRNIVQPADPNPISLSDQLAVVDFIYTDAAGSPFGYHNYGILPYWEDAEWQHLFSWYGKKKYGFVPSRRAGNPLYLIYEPDPFLPEFQKKWLMQFRSPDKGPVVLRKKFPVYTLEKFDKRANVN